MLAGCTWSSLCVTAPLLKQSTLLQLEEGGFLSIQVDFHKSNMQRNTLQSLFNLRYVICDPLSENAQACILKKTI